MRSGLSARRLRQHAIFVAIFLVAGVASGVLFTDHQRPLYEASSKVFVSAGSATNAADLFQGANFTQQIVKSYADVVDSDAVINRVIADLGLKGSAAKYAASISASAPTDTAVLEIDATSDSAADAANLANSAANNLAIVAQQLSPSSEGDSAGVKLTVIQRAEPPVSPNSPNLLLNSFAGGIFGAFLAFIAILLRNGLDRRLRTEWDFERVTEITVIGRVPTLQFRNSSLSQELLQQNSAFVESMRSTVVNLRFLTGQGGGSVIIVTSPEQGDGKSSIAVSLAVIAALGGHKVCIVDADLRRPTVAAVLGLDGSFGLSDLLTGTGAFELAFQVWGPQQLTVIPSGDIPPNPADLLGSTRFTDLIRHLRDSFEYIILDAPPMLPVSDAVTMSRAADGVVLVAALNKTRVPDIQAVVRESGLAEFKIYGAVMNFTGPIKASSYYAY